MLAQVHLAKRFIRLMGKCVLDIKCFVLFTTSVRRIFLELIKYVTCKMRTETHAGLHIKCRQFCSIVTKTGTCSQIYKIYKFFYMQADRHGGTRWRICESIFFENESIRTISLKMVCSHIYCIRHTHNFVMCCSIKLCRGISAVSGKRIRPEHEQNGVHAVA